jgi:hypothetical protein
MVAALQLSSQQDERAGGWAGCDAVFRSVGAAGCGRMMLSISERQHRKGRKGNEGRLRGCEARTEAARGLVEINEYLMMESSGTGTGSCIKLSCQVVDIIDMGTFPAVAGAAPPAS